MSATPRRCSRCSGSGSRSGRSTRCSSPTTPAPARGAAPSFLRTAPWRASRATPPPPHPGAPPHQ
ncbi:hypothetical protein CCS92_33050, partial [Methylobacterium radiotolerans]